MSWLKNALPPCVVPCPSCLGHVRRCGLARGVLPCCVWLGRTGRLFFPALVPCLVALPTALRAACRGCLLALCVWVGSVL